MTRVSRPIPGSRTIGWHTCLLIGVLAGLPSGAAPSGFVLAEQPSTVIQYADPQGRFAFEYPESFGTPSRGTDDGHGPRAAAVRFAIFSRQGVGGELVVTTGPPTIDLQAAGGLYDPFGRDIFPDPVRRTVVAALPRMTAANFCQLIATDRHLEPTIPGLSSLTAQQRQALPRVDQLGNVDPVVRRCDISGGIAVFEKEAGMAAGGTRRPVYGAVRFLEGRYSSVQIVRAVHPPSAAVLEEMRRVIASWRPR